MVDLVKAGIPADFSLARGESLKAVADATSNGKMWLLPGHGTKDAFDARVIAAGATVTIGPYNYAIRVHIEAYAGAISYLRGDNIAVTGITQAAYNALVSPDPNTLYVITG